MTLSVALSGPLGAWFSQPSAGLSCGLQGALPNKALQLDGMLGLLRIDMVLPWLDSLSTEEKVAPQLDDLPASTVISLWARGVSTPDKSLLNSNR
jgi:hypothetical protein